MTIFNDTGVMFEQSLVQIVQIPHMCTKVFVNICVLMLHFIKNFLIVLHKYTHTHIVYLYPCVDIVCGKYAGQPTDTAY